MTLNGDGDSGTRSWPGEVILMVEEEVLPAMQADPWHVWLMCECGESVSYERDYGLSESPNEFVAYAKAGLAEAYHEHLLEEHD